MKRINLRELYPDVYPTDFFIDVTEEVMETIRAAERAEAAYERKMYRYKAQYSLDCENGIENAVLLKPQTPEMQIKIIRAKDAIASQKPRIVRCPYCRHNSIIVFEDTRGHVQTKCKACGRETVFNVLEMRRLRRLQLYYSSLNG